MAPFKTQHANNTNSIPPSKMHSNARTGSSIIQWNIRGLKRNLLECQNLLRKYSPLAICLQETKLNCQENLNHVGNYRLHREDLISNTIAHGGVAIAILAGIPHYRLPLNTPLQAIAIKLELPKFQLTLCSLYLNPNEPISNAELSALVNQLSHPYMLLGDFNSHHTVWGSKQSDPRGNGILKFMQFENLCLMNSGKQTYHNLAHNSLSAIDLSLCTPGLLSQFNWDTHLFTLSSDHFPIVIRFNDSPKLSVRPPS